MKTLRRSIAAVVIFLAVVCLAGCGRNSADKNKNRGEDVPQPAEKSK